MPEKSRRNLFSRSDVNRLLTEFASKPSEKDAFLKKFETKPKEAVEQIFTLTEQQKKTLARWNDRDVAKAVETFSRTLREFGDRQIEFIVDGQEEGSDPSPAHMTTPIEPGDLPDKKDKDPPAGKRKYKWGIVIWIGSDSGPMTTPTLPKLPG